jgi:hypothetical protein
MGMDPAGDLAPGTSTLRPGEFMPVLVDCTTVLIRNATVEARYSGGVAAFERKAPNSTFCTDGLICRLSFMHPADQMAYVDHLSRLGFQPPTQAGSPEIAVIHATHGFQFPCSWLQAAEAELDGGQRVVVAWLLGTDASTIVAPPGWEPHSGCFELSDKQLEEDYEFVELKDGVETRRHRVTGELIYQGRPTGLPRKRWWEFWKS